MVEVVNESKTESSTDKKYYSIDIRLTPIGRKLGIVDDERWAFFENKLEQIELEKQRLNNYWVGPGNAIANKLNKVINSPINKEQTLLEILRRPEMTFNKLMETSELQPIATNHN